MNAQACHLRLMILIPVHIVIVLLAVVRRRVVIVGVVAASIMAR